MHALGGEILVITGPPGSGKTTMARALVERLDLAVLLEGDWFFERVVRGWIPPWTRASQDQNDIVTRALAAAARQYALGAYPVVVEGIIGPWFLDTFVAVTGDIPVSYVVIRPSADTAMARAVARDGPATDTTPVSHMYGAFADLGSHERYVVDTSGHAVDETVDAVLARLEAGSLRL